MFSIKKLAGLGAGVLLLASALTPVAQASSLTQSQISAIISLLQSFGADQSVINNVSSALGGGDQGGGSLSCSSFSDVSYGQFDNYPGGRVSQLQTWLGIPSGTFGFGTYGKKTQAAWNAKCGANPQPQPYPNPQPPSHPELNVHILGNLNAHVKVVEYCDTESPFCKTGRDTARQLVAHYGLNGAVAWEYLSKYKFSGPNYY